MLFFRFSCEGVRLNRLPGWEKNSWGYHGDDGNSFASEREGTPFGPRFTSTQVFQAVNPPPLTSPFSATDVIGCGIDFSVNKAFYTKNRIFLGMFLPMSASSSHVTRI